MTPEKLRVAREKLTRVFRYLEALNQHRNPAKRQIREQLWSFWLHDLPDHPAIKRGGTKSASAKNKPAEFPNGDTGSGEFVLKVQRPALSSPPEPPSSVATWLEAGWDDPSKEPLVSASRNESDQGGETRMANFADVAGRLAALQSWKVAREEWARNEKPARAAMKIFETRYSLYGRIDREAERPVELYSALFQSMTDVDGRAIGRCREELEQEGFHPLVNGATSGFLKRLVVQLSPRGELLEDRAPAGEANDPQ